MKKIFAIGYVVLALLIIVHFNYALYLYFTGHKVTFIPITIAILLFLISYRAFFLSNKNKGVPKMRNPPPPPNNKR